MYKNRSARAYRNRRNGLQIARNLLGYSRKEQDGGR